MISMIEGRVTGALIDKGELVGFVGVVVVDVHSIILNYNEVIRFELRLINRLINNFVICL
jgi:hypothetical protein